MVPREHGNEVISRDEWRKLVAEGKIREVAIDRGNGGMRTYSLVINVISRHTRARLSGGCTWLLKLQAGGSLKFFTDVHHLKAKHCR